MNLDSVILLAVLGLGACDGTQLPEAFDRSERSSSLAPQLKAPDVTATIDGSDVSISWQPPPSGVQCTLERNDNQGQNWQQPATLISPCPASAVSPCVAYDPALLRGNYNYRLRCTDGRSTVTSKPYPATGALNPGVELCVGNSNTIYVYAISPDRTRIKLSRTISSNTNLQFVAGVAYVPASNSNCAPSDHRCGTLFASSFDNGMVISVDRRANDASVGTVLWPPASEQILHPFVSPGSNGQPAGLAVLGPELLVGLFQAPGYVASYSLVFPPQPQLPNWYFSGSRTQLGVPRAVAVDAVSNLIFVGSSPPGPQGSSKIAAYRRFDIQPAPSNHEAFVFPSFTITPSFRPDTLAVDSTRHKLYTTGGGSNQVETYSTANGSPLGVIGIVTSNPIALAFLDDASGGTLYAIDGFRHTLTAFPGGAVGQVFPLLNFFLPELTDPWSSLTICN
jgi:hypothetical protein